MTNPYTEIINRIHASDKKITGEYNEKNKDPNWTNISAERKFMEKRIQILSLALLELLSELEKKHV